MIPGYIQHCLKFANDIDNELLNVYNVLWMFKITRAKECCNSSVVIPLL